MAPKKVSDNSKPKRKVVRATVEVKKQTIAKYESGMYVFFLAMDCLMPKSTIGIILKNKVAD